MHLFGDGKFWNPRREALVVGVCVLAAYLLWSTADDLVIGAFRDDGIYVSLGKALASGEGYRSIHLAGEPVQVKYPPGLPVLFAGVWWLGGTLRSVQSIIFAMNLLVTATAASMIWWLGRRRLQLPAGVVLAFAITPFLLDPSIQYFSIPISEPYFMLAWAAALVLYSKLVEAAQRGGGAPQAVALGVVLAGATLLRSQAAVLIPAMLLPLLLDRSHRRLGTACGITALVPIAAWQWLHGRWVAAGPISTQPDALSYLEWLPLGSPLELAHGVPQVVASNWLGYWDLFVPYLSGTEDIGVVVGACFLLLVLAGAILEARRHPALVFTTLGSAVVVLLWPFNQDRLVLSLLPFAGLLAASMTHRAIRPRDTLLKAVAYGLLFICVGSVVWRQFDIRMQSTQAVTDGASAAYFSPNVVLRSNSAILVRVSRWIRTHTSRDDRVLVFTPSGVYLHTGRKAVSSAPTTSRFAPSVFESPGEYLARRIRDDSVTVVVLGSLRGALARDIATLQERCPGVVRYQGSVEAQSLPSFYRVVRQGDCIQTKILRAAPARSGRGEGSSKGSTRNESRHGPLASVPRLPPLDQH